MSDAWFFADPLPAAGDEAALDQREARHAGGARRLAAGDAITLFDGRGQIARAGIMEAARKRVCYRVNSREEQPPPWPRVHLAAALPKGDRQAIMLGMATQLGMASFTPLTCARSVVRASSGFADRAQRVMLEACKQSRRAWLPVVHGPASPVEVIAAADAMTLVAHPDGRPLREVMREDSMASATVLIGPEGGFAEAELAAMDDAAGAQRIALGESILRIETAAVATIAAIMLVAHRG